MCKLCAVCLILILKVPGLSEGSAVAQGPIAGVGGQLQAAVEEDVVVGMSGSATDGPTQRGMTLRAPDGPRAQRRLRGVNGNVTPIGAENVRS